ncbi:hypothetical protein V6N13_098961 [Hibiscus sabdariffa]|uniref:Uncharacterized protein n=1 Tax=Hibiscus sabdariffa TaxID=183260 RepID=A0ABR2P9V3_9ROSI
MQGCSSPRLYEVAGSQPSDDIPQRSSKKSRGGTETNIEHDSMTVDDEKPLVETAIGVDLNQTMDGKKDSDRTTYASKAAVNGSSDNGANGSIGFLEYEVTTLEEDIILD